VLLRQSQAPHYWADKFRIDSADLDYIMALFLEKALPLSTHELALSVVEHRLHTEDQRLRKLIAQGAIYQPKNTYAVGQELIFPAFGYQTGIVTATRPGDNSEYSAFTVITVMLADRTQREFATAFQGDHKLNMAVGESEALLTRPASAEGILAEHEEAIVDELEAKLVDVPDAAYFAGRWFLKSLLSKLQQGELNLADAMLDLSQGGPMTTKELLEQLDMSKNVPEAVHAFSLDLALSGDDRFDEVGPAGVVWWFSRRFEPPEVTKIPERLIYQPVTYDASLLNADMRAMEAEIDDEYSDLPPASRAKEARLTLIYPHRRAATLPLTSRVQALFPIANEATRILVTLIDEEADEEFPVWLIRDRKYVVGLEGFYRRHKIPIGAYLTLRATDDPARLIIRFSARKAQSEHIPLVTPNNNRLNFVSFKRAIGTDYDAFMVLGAENPDDVDATVQTMMRTRVRSVPELMRDVMLELAKLNLQNAVHAKTIYSAVNIIRRCPPGPIFAALLSRPEFENVAGPYWRATPTP